MKPIIRLKTISEINAFVQCTTHHPLVAVVDFSKVDEYLEEGTRMSADFYTIMFKNYCANQLRYGRKTYDFQEGNLLCIAPNQVITLDNEVSKREDKLGWGLFFHPDILSGTPLGKKIHEYSFFSYDTAEALHLSDKEKDILFDCVKKIEAELNENIDNHSQTLIVSNIALLLDYCARYYGRQFITRKPANSNIVAMVESYLNAYFKNQSNQENGLPTVKTLADYVSLSPGYLSDLLKKETGMNAQDHIHYKLIEEAKSILLSEDKSVSEIAYSLGFEYPQYFSKLFKQKTGKTPLAFRETNS